jgi:hypothetical protein
MKIKIGQVEIGLSVVAYSTGNGFEITIDAPIGENVMALFASYMPKATNTFAARMEIGKGAKNAEESTNS